MATVRLVLGLGMTIVLLGIAGVRLLFLYRVGTSAQPIEPGRVSRTGDIARAEVVEVAGQRKLLRWTAPGLAHLAVFWGFMVLVLTIIEGFGALFSPTFQIPVIGNWPALGFVEDLFAVLCLLAVAAFTVIRLRESPKEHGRSSRFFGSHLGAAWFTLFMIVNVVWTLMLARGAQINAQEVNTTDNLPFLRGAFVSQWFASLLAPLGETANEVVESVALLLALGVLLGFTVFVTYSKHLHILLSLPNVALAPPPARARGAAADPLGREAGRLRGPRRGRPHGCRQDRGLHVEGAARLRHVHRVRPLPEPVPRLEHRQAALAQAPHHDPARPRARQGPVAHRRRGGPRRTRRRAARCRVGPARRGDGVCRGRAAHGIPADRSRSGHRHRRPLVVHDLRRLRRAVPRRHRARRPHRRHAALPGAHGVGLPRGGRHHAEQPRARRRPVGPRGRAAPAVGRAARLRRAGARRRRRDDDPRRRRVPLLGRLRRSARRGRPADRPGGRDPAPRGGGRVHGARRRRVLHRRPGPPDGPRVPLPDARASRTSRSSTRPVPPASS